MLTKVQYPAARAWRLVVVRTGLPRGMVLRNLMPCLLQVLCQFFLRFRPALPDDPHLLGGRIFVTHSVPRLAGA
jgi:hypothetical protein